MENLTKENFFNDLMKKYPEAMKKFCEWIDKYKERVDWDGRLFKNNYTSRSVAAYIKFHDLPYEMQLGIMLKFGQEYTEQDESMLEIREEFTEILKNIHLELATKN